MLIVAQPLLIEENVILVPDAMLAVVGKDNPILIGELLVKLTGAIDITVVPGAIPVPVTT